MNFRINSLLLLLTSVFFLSCRKNDGSQTTKEKPVLEKSQDTANPLVVNMLNNFYYVYLGEVASSTDLRQSEIKLDSLKAIYCTKNLIEKVNAGFASGDLDYDPFINAQDADLKMRETIAVTYIQNSKNKYEVKYRIDDSDDVIKVIVTVIEDSGKYKISSLD